MTRIQSIVLVVFCATSAVFSRAFASPPRQQQTAPPAAVSLHKMVKREQRDRSEVQRLQHDVAAQEAHSEQAARHLQQQDQAISTLRKQLDALQARQAASQR